MKLKTKMGISHSKIDDPRFSSMQSDPIFKKNKKDQHKVKLDNRFTSLLTDDRFRVAPGQIDRYGRKVNKTSSATEELQSFYEIADGDKLSNLNELDGDDKEEKSQSAKSVDPISRLEYLTRLSRGEISASSDDSDDDDQIEIDTSGDDYDDNKSALTRSRKSPLDIVEDEEDISLGDATTRLAILNCDWDHIRAKDIMVVLQSFCPTGGSVKSVTIYLSDYGKEKISEEEKFGPKGIWIKSSSDSVPQNPSPDDNNDIDDDDEDIIEDLVELDSNEEDDDNQDDDSDEDGGDGENKNKYGDFQRRRGAAGIVLQQALDKKINNSNKSNSKGKSIKGGDIDEVALRSYELQRLRYYFAVAIFDSINSAEVIYTELDGTEFEHSSISFDLRFIPNDINFNDREVKDSVEGSIQLETYKPPDFIVNALQHSNVSCTWDEGDSDRNKQLQKGSQIFSQWRDFAESDLQAYVASSDSSDDDEDENMKEIRKQKGEKMRRLLLGDDAEDDDDDELQDDDFFLNEEGKRGAGGGGILDEEKTFTFIPKEDKITSHKESEKNDKIKNKKDKNTSIKNKKLTEKKDEYIVSTNIENVSNEDDDDDEGDELKRNKANLELMFAGDIDVNDYDMKAVVKEQSLTNNKKKKNRKKRKLGISDDLDVKANERRDAVINNSDFQINVEDNRFQQLLVGDPRFGIDRTAPEFKDTVAMRTILNQQRQIRSKQAR